MNCRKNQYTSTDFRLNVALKKINRLPRVNIALTFLFLVISTLASATDYYISASGNDSNNNGLSPSTPWKTITKVNSAFSNLKPGDQILFNRGDTFYGSLVISKSGASGSPITFGAYGTGVNPIISGFTTLTSWTNYSGNIYYATLDVPRLNIVTLNGVVKGMGRFPNTGYLNYESHNAKVSITDNQLTGDVNWTGAEIGIRKNRWIIDRHIVTNHTGSTLTYNSLGDYGDNTFYLPFDGNGYFFQNDIKCLDDLGDWYYDTAANRIYMYFSGSPSGYTVKVGSLDYNIALQNTQTYIDIVNIDCEGANLIGIDLSYDAHINITDCNINFQGCNGIDSSISNNLTVTRGSITNALSVALIFGNQVDSTTIDGLEITNAGNILGAHRSGDGTGNGMFINGNNNSIRNCKVINTGYNGIHFDGDDALIENNFVDTFCTVKDDGGGIYTYISDGAIIRNNIVLNAIGSYSGSEWSWWEPYGKAAGIYLDGGVANHNAEVTGNTVAHGEWDGIFINNNGGNTITNNIVYNYAQQLEISLYASGVIRNTTITGNQFISRTFTQHTLSNKLYVDENPSLFGTFSNNYYARPIDDNLTIQTAVNGNTFTHRTLNEWKSYSGQDANSHKSPVAITDTSDIVFHYNETNINKIIPLSHPMIDVKGAKYIKSITLLPFTSAVLMVDPNPDQPIIPVYVSSEIGNNTPAVLEMTYNLSLANVLPAISAFTVLVNSAARVVNAVAISGTKVQLTLASAIAFGDVVTLTYTKPALSPLQTTSAGLAASVTAQAVSNNVSVPVPVYVSAAVGNAAPSQIEMTYNLSLANIVPAASAITVIVNSVAREVNAVAISGTKVQLTLAGAIAFGDVVTVAYTKPLLNPLQSTSAGQAVTVSAQAVTNNLSAPVPVFISAAVGNAAPSLIEMTYSLSLANSVPATSAFTVLVNSAARAVNAVAISGTKVQLTLASAIVFGNVVTVAYTKPAMNPLQTTSAGQAASISAQAVTNSINPPVPVYLSSTVGNAAPSQIEMTYNLSLANIIPATSAFTVLVNSVARAVNTVAISGTKVQITLASAIAFGDVVTVAYAKPVGNPLQTTSAGLAASFSAQAVTNNVSAPVPVYVGSAVGNAAPSLIEITYDLSLANIVPAASAFTVLLNSAARAVNAVAISGTKVQLTLSGAIAFGDVVTVAYTKPSLNPLQTTSAGQAASFSAQAVTNNVSAPVPVVVSAAVGNTTPSLIEITYDLSLANIVPVTSAFTVLVNSAARAVNAVAISGTKVQLTLSGAIAFGDVVTVAYTKPSLNPLQTTSAGQAASFSAQAVTNNVSAPVPVVVSATVGNTAPSLIEITYDLGLANIVPVPSAFTVLVNSAARAVNAVAISGTKVQLTLSSAIAFGDVVTVAYSKPSANPIQTSSTAMAVSVSAQAVINNVSAPVPVVVSAAVGNTTPSLIEMTYNLSLANIVPVTSAFTVLVNSAARAVNTVSISGTKVQLTLASAIAFGDVVTVAYTKPSANPIQTSSTAMAVSVSAQAVINNVSAPVPIFVSATVGNTAPSLIEMTYNLSLANIVPVTSAFTVLVNSAARAVNTVSISGTKVQLTLASQVLYGDVVTVTYTKPSANPIQTSSAAMAVSVSAQAVTNNVSAPVPVYVGSAVGNAAPSLIEMTYNLGLANITPATSAYTVLVNSAARAVNALAISGTKVQLTLASAIAFGDVVTVAYTKPSANPIQTSSAAMAVSVSAQAVINNVSAPVPIFVSATVGNTAPSLIEMTYNLSLANIVPVTSAFTVLVNSAARAVNTVSISGTKVQLTFTSATAFGDVVTVTYKKPAVNPLQTTSDGQAASFSAQAVTNNVNFPSPVYVSSVIGNNTPAVLEMTYNLSLANIEPATSAFTVLVNSVARAVNAVTISGTKVQLTLASAIALDDVVTVAYTKPAVNPLQTTSDGLAASISAQAVTNNVSAPVPVYVGSAVGNAAPSLIEMTYNLSLANIVPATSAFTVLVNSAARAVNTVSISGTKVQLTLTSATAFGDVVTVGYTKPAVNPLQTTSDGLAASISAQAVINNVSAPVPVVVSSAVGNATPSQIEMAYNLSLANIVPVTSAFTVRVNSAARAVNSVSISGTKIQLTLASQVLYGDVVTVTYTRPSANPIQTSSEGLAESINAQTVTNNSLKIVGGNPLPDPFVDTEENKLTIYPNPAHDFFNLSFDDLTIEPQRLKIIDLSGRIVLTQLIEQGTQNIQIPVNFNPGNYIVTIATKNKIISTQKLIILHR